MTELITARAPRGKVRVVADSFGKWASEHEDILVGDFDTLDAARAAAAPWFKRPKHEHWSVMCLDEKGRII